MRSLTALLLLWPGLLQAAAFDRPVPQAQTDAAEFWFAIASPALLASLIAVQWLVSRR
ncbi:hypothetical protein [Cereibacter changlensis]|uniref:hypothetical protein n=1 Tax=Cereibacter changlensis TaxID=402884 RepID=UPI00145DA611|nr:hypothetical protein [Cereibacter changlensis]